MSVLGSQTEEASSHFCSSYYPFPSFQISKWLLIFHLVTFFFFFFNKKNAMESNGYSGRQGMWRETKDLGGEMLLQKVTS